MGIVSSVKSAVGRVVQRVTGQQTKATVTTTTATSYKATPSQTVGKPATITVSKPSTTTTQTYAPSKSGGGSSGGGSQTLTPSSQAIQGPVRPGETTVSGVDVSNRPISLPYVPPQTNMNQYGTRTDIGQVDLLKPVNTNTGFAKVQDFGRALLVTPALGGWGVETVYGGETGRLASQQYEQQRGQIASDFWKRGGILNPVAYFDTVRKSYNLQQEQRIKTDIIKTAFANTLYKDFSPEASQASLIRAGVSFIDIPLNKTITTETIGDVTYTNTSTSFNPKIEFRSMEQGIIKYYLDTGQTGKAYTNIGIGAGVKVGEMYLGGKILKFAGVLGGASTEGGFVGQALTTGAGKFTPLGKILEFTTRPAVALTGVGLAGVEGATGVFSSSYNTLVNKQPFELGGGYKLGKETGLNKIATSLIGGATSVGQVYAFTAGATGGEISPFQTNKLYLKSSTGQTKTLTTFSVGEPFSGKYFGVGSNLQGVKTSLGYMPLKNLEGYSVIQGKGTYGLLNQQAFGTAQGESMIKFYGKSAVEYQAVTPTVSKLRMGNLPSRANVDLMNQKTFSDMSKAQQMQWTKEMQTLGGDTSAYGFRRFTGSITGTYGRQAGDIDVVLGAKANSAGIAKDIAGRMGKGFSSSQGQIYFKGAKVFEGLTPENAIPRPMGYFGRYAQSATISGVGTKAGKTLVTPAGQSLTELGSAIRYPSAFTSKGLVFTIDKPQRVADFAVTASKLSQASGKPFNVEAFKSAYAKYNVNWESGRVASTISSTASLSSVASSSVTSTAVAVFMPKGASVTSANVRAFIPSRVSTSSSISSKPSTSSISGLSKSSISSLSSISSRSSRSSSSSSSASSLSSLSSRSSSSSSVSSSFSSLSSLSSRSSSSSSSSSFFSSFATTFPPFIPTGITSGKVGIKVGEIKASRSYAYTPSFKAIVFNIRGGKTPLASTKFSGLETRKITKAFKWGRLIK